MTEYVYKGKKISQVSSIGKMKQRKKGTIDQHTVLVKIDNETWEKFEEFKDLLGIKRNRLINIAIKQWLQWNMR